MHLILKIELSFEAQLIQSLHKGNDISHIPARTHLKKQISFQLETLDSKAVKQQNKRDIYLFRKPILHEKPFTFDSLCRVMDKNCQSLF